MVGMQSWIPPPAATKATSTWRSRPTHDVGDMDLIEMLQHECDMTDHEQIEAMAVQAWKNTSTTYDVRDMYRLGKAQEFRRSYRPLSALSFAIVLTAIWEYLMISCTQGLVDGGSAGMIWSYIWTFVWFTFVEMSVAEMASMAPISGGQYHWVSEFAPPAYQKFFSYLVGWMSVLSWQAGNAADCFLTGTIAQALIAMNNPNYDPTRWQGTLFVFAMILLVFFFNIWGYELWPKVQNLLMILHVLAFVAVVITLWCLAPHRSAKAVFTDFSNKGGWSSIGLSLMVGQISSIYSLLGSDATAHMAEEVRDASRYVSHIDVLVVLRQQSHGDYISHWIFVRDARCYPFLYVFEQAVDIHGINALTIIVMMIVSAANINFGASTARQTFAFARDQGLPFASWIAKVDTAREIPTNAIMLTSVIAALLACINIGSTTAFNAIVSLQVVSLMFTYACSLSCLLYRRFKDPGSLPPARWSLGRWGTPVNIIGLGYSLFSFFWSFWPTYTRVSADDFNWSVVIFVLVLMFCLVMYVAQGRAVYNGPVHELRRISIASTRS